MARLTMMPKCSRISPISLIVMAIVIGIWMQLKMAILTAEASKINELSMDEKVISVPGHLRHFHNHRLPVFNVSGILSLNSIDLDACNRTFRAEMNELFLDVCSNTVCRKRRSLSPSNFESMKEYIASRFSPTSAASDDLESEQEFQQPLSPPLSSIIEQDQIDNSDGGIMMEPMLHSSSSSSTRYNQMFGRNNKMMKYQRKRSQSKSKTKSQRAMEVMDKCCKVNVDCTLKFLRDEFAKICGNSCIIDNVQVFQT